MEQGRGKGPRLGLSSVCLANSPTEEAAATLIKFTAEVMWEGGVSIREMNFAV